MAVDISGIGCQIVIKASKTWPNGLLVSQFADDANPLDIPSMQIADKAMSLNGDLVKWSKANPIPVTINIIPDSTDDTNIGVLFEANRVARNKKSSQDEIDLIVTDPNTGAVTTFTGGLITDGMPATGISQTGRKITKAYVFSFENVVRVSIL